MNAPPLPASPDLPDHQNIAVERFVDPDRLLACIHCGLCLSSCPTYLETGNENDSPRGRIHLMRAIQDGRLPLGDSAVRHLDLCLGCRACEAACPSGVRYGELLEGTRNHVEHHYPRPLWQQFLRRILIEQIFPFPERLELALLPARLAKKLGLDRWLPRFARDALALVPADFSPVEIPALTLAAADTPRQGRVGFITGCVMSVMFGETNAASVRLLRRAGWDVVTPRAQGCCGALYAHGGQLADARACARRNLEVFEGLDLDAIIINAAGCGSTLKEYGHLLQDDPAWAGRGAAFSRKVKDLSEWLSGVSGSEFRVSSPELSVGGAPDNPKPETRNSKLSVTYHDACHLAHAQRITQAPRDLVRAMAGRHYVELPEAEVCCGSAGSYNLTEPEMAERLQRRKIENILKSGAQIVVTTNPGCLLQIRAGLRQAGASHILALHLADYLEGRGERGEVRGGKRESE